MSQSGVLRVSTGVLPPVVPIQFTTDDGAAIPSMGNLNVFGIDSTENNANGILTRANPNLSQNLDIIITNRIQGIVTTIGAATSPIITFSPTVIGTYAIEIRISAYNTTSILGSGYSVFGTIRFDGANSNLCGTPDKITNEEGTMTSANCTMTVSGGNVLINGVGYAAQTINWSAVGLYTFVGA